MSRLLLSSVPRKSCVISFDLRVSRSFVSITGRSTSQMPDFLNINQKRYGSSMNVILLENVANRGSRGEIVQVKRGYARNMLIPRKLAAYATPENKTKHEVIIEHRAKLIADGIIDATNVALSNASLIPQLANVAESQVIEFVRPIVTGSKGQLIGTVTVQDIQEYLREGGYEMTSAANIMIPSVKNIGFYPIEIGDKKCILHVLQEIGAKIKEVKK